MNDDRLGVLYLFGLLVYAIIWTVLLRDRDSLGRRPRTILIAGHLLNTLALLFALFLQPAFAYKWVYETLGVARTIQFYQATDATSRLGELLFAIGFAAYGLGIAGVRRRRSELENVIAAKVREIELLRGVSFPHVVTGSSSSSLP